MDQGKGDKKLEADDNFLDEAIRAINDSQTEAEELGLVAGRTPPLGLSQQEGMEKTLEKTKVQRENNVGNIANSEKLEIQDTLSPITPVKKAVPRQLPPLGLAATTGVSTKSINSLLSGGAKGAGNLRPPLGERAASKNHNRMVSWGIDGAPPNLTASASEDTSEFAPRTPQSRMSKISLLSVLNTNPYESEAEAYLHHTLDDTDPTDPEPGISKAQQTIMGSVPAEAAPSTFGATPTKNAASSGWGKIRKGIPQRRGTNTAADLFSLAMDFADLDKDDSSSVHKSPKNKGHRKNASSSADALANAGAALIRRNRLDSTDSYADHKNGVSAITGSRPRPSLAASRGKASLRLMRGQSMRSSLASSDLEAHISENRVAEETSEDNENSDSGDDDNNDDNGKGRNSSKFRRLKQANYKLKANYKDFEQWLKYEQLGYRDYVKFILTYLIIPLVGIAAILFYFTDNPPCGTTTQCYEIYSGVEDEEVISVSGVTLSVNANPAASNSTTPKEDVKVSIDSLRRTFQTASISFWLLFLARQCVTFSLAKLAEAILIEYLALRTKVVVFFFGPMVTLFLVQSKGWPVVAILWAILDFFMLYGDGKFAQHWLFWQDAVKLFNLRNPGGTVTSSEDYRLILVVMMVVGMAVAVKRFWLGIYLGRQTFLRYAEELAKLMRKALLVGKVAALARDIEQRTNRSSKNIALDTAKFYEADESSKGDISLGEEESKSNKEENTEDLYEELRISSEHKGRILELLGAFEDPTEASNQKDENAPISAIIQFRASLSRLNTPFPFGNSFGPAGTRGECIESIEGVYHRLMQQNSTEVCLHFNTIAAMAVRNDGELDEGLLKELVKLFRPDRDGTLRLLDFAKSIDSVYKELRLLRASVASASRMDRAFEGIINVAFYFLLFCIVLSVMGLDPLVLFASVSGFVLGFAFMIGSACSKYFEGVLLILVRHPYDVGDRIAVSNPESDTPPTGSSGWIVKDIDLFTTTVIFGTTNEVATYSNGSLASSRIINAGRSNKATVYFLFKFPIDAPYQRIQVFRSALDKFVKARPREWIGLLAFRNTRVEADLGFVEYIIVCQHRESWQNVGALLNSKAEVSSFALELMKKMKMRYRAPPMPVDLTLMNDVTKMADPPEYSFPDGNIATRSRADTNTSMDIESVEAMFK